MAFNVDWVIDQRRCFNYRQMFALCCIVVHRAFDDDFPRMCGVLIKADTMISIREIIYCGSMSVFFFIGADLPLSYTFTFVKLLKSVIFFN